MTITPVPPDDQEPLAIPVFETLIGEFSYALLRDRQMLMNQFSIDENQAMTWIGVAATILQSYNQNLILFNEENEDGDIDTTPKQ